MVSQEKNFKKEKFTQRKKNSNDTLESTITISACSDLSGVPANQRLVILTASFRVSLDPFMSRILSGMRAIVLHKKCREKYAT